MTRGGRGRLCIVPQQRAGVGISLVGMFSPSRGRKSADQSLFDEKMVVLGSMRHMTGKASLFTGNGCVDCRPFLLLVGMATETERIYSRPRGFRSFGFCDECGL